MEAAVGRRVLGEVEEASLDEILTSFRTTLHAISAGHAAAADAAGLEPANDSTRITTGSNKRLAHFPVPALNDLAERHLRATSSPTLSVSGRHLQLLYKLVSTLVARPHGKAVVVIDLEHRFDVSRVLQCSPYQEPPREPPAPPGDDGGAARNDTAGATAAAEGGDNRAGQPEAPPPLVTLADLEHIHVYRPARSPRTRVADLVAAAEHRMLYGQHGSRRREWWGTIVIGRAPAAGGGGAGSVNDVAVEAGWRGWLQVAAAQEASSFGSCLSLEEALLERERRQRAAARQQTWVASSVWGGFEFTES